jgi:hypothetical protein
MPYRAVRFLKDISPELEKASDPQQRAYYVGPYMWHRASRRAKIFSTEEEAAAFVKSATLPKGFALTYEFVLIP